MANLAALRGIVDQLGIVLRLLRHTRLRHQDVEIVRRADQRLVAIVERLLQVATRLVRLRQSASCRRPRPRGWRKTSARSLRTWPVSFADPARLVMACSALSSSVPAAIEMRSTWAMAGKENAKKRMTTSSEPLQRRIACLRYTRKWNCDFEQANRSAERGGVQERRWALDVRRWASGVGRWASGVRLAGLPKSVGLLRYSSLGSEQADTLSQRECFSSRRRTPDAQRVVNSAALG